MDRGEVTSLILLELSAAFDTVDLVLSLVFKIVLVLIVFLLIGSHPISLSGSLNKWFHLCILYSFL